MIKSQLQQTNHTIKIIPNPDIFKLLHSSHDINYQMFRKISKYALSARIVAFSFIIN